MSYTQPSNIGATAKEIWHWTLDHWFEIPMFIVLVALAYFGCNDIGPLRENDGGLPASILLVGLLFYFQAQKSNRTRLLEGMKQRL